MRPPPRRPLTLGTYKVAPGVRQLGCFGRAAVTQAEILSNICIFVGSQLARKRALHGLLSVRRAAG